METKLFEVRDEGICIPVVAIQTAATNDAERWLLGCADYDADVPYVLLSPLTGGRPMHYDPYHWGPRTTMQVAHEYICKHWATLETGDVIDVQYILGFTQKPKVSDRLYAEGQ